MKEKILSSQVGQIGALLFSAYTLAWSIIEPLNLDWINNHKSIWRLILLVFAGTVTLVLSIRLSRSLLDKIDADGLDRTLQGSYSSTGNPQMTVSQDGHIGNIVRIIGNFSLDESDWIIKSSAQKAKKLEFIFKSHSTIHFYLRVGMLSQNGQTSISRWIRFDSNLTSPDPYAQNSPELGVPYDSTPLHSFNEAEIDISEAVKQSYGQGGWTYNKIMIFRIRCHDAIIKSVSFKK